MEMDYFTPSWKNRQNILASGYRPVSTAPKASTLICKMTKPFTLLSDTVVSETIAARSPISRLARTGRLSERDAYVAVRRSGFI